jgi:hypothetical protein
MGRKHDTMWQNSDVGWRKGTTGEGKVGDDASCADTNLTGPKNEENTRGRFNCYKWIVKI